MSGHYGFYSSIFIWLYGAGWSFVGHPVLYGLEADLARCDHVVWRTNQITAIGMRPALGGGDGATVQGRAFKLGPRCFFFLLFLFICCDCG